jgi:hypothetical protein
MRQLFLRSPLNNDLRLKEVFNILFSDNALIDGDREYGSWVMVELSKAVAKLWVFCEVGELLVMLPEARVHGLVNKHGGIEANEEGRPIISPDLIYQASTI